MVIKKVIGVTRDSRKRLIIFFDENNKIKCIQIISECKQEIIADNEYSWEEVKTFNLYDDEVFRMYKAIADYI